MGCISDILPVQLDVCSPKSISASTVKSGGKTSDSVENNCCSLAVYVLGSIAVCVRSSRINAGRKGVVSQAACNGLFF
ncbi:hypothetical protein D3C74_447360 [compost metagenome]